ncbi:hypothetical protein CkaCkLH20_03603 [Colletotrichum karsti]|uniref:Rhodopsin domain-containing protein n=1 Tax=Colletotrichum karsti TaxID=1095194 RepID=A0A9P6I9A1_9PEZI|nr:uncharacterized protein CkaCkLH20_03603 [Colletotrichum karsti]KAF9878703.1 hypothetical protein CkaCkLH20_03603 [Colletotrichum karsti]
MLIWTTSPQDMESIADSTDPSAAPWEDALPPGSLESRSDLILVIGIIMTVLATVFFALRVYVRAFMTRKWGADDTLLTFAFFAVVLHNSMLCVATRFGLGKHVWMNSVKNLLKGQKIALFVVIVYQVAFVTIKIAFLLQYRRVFPLPKVELLCNLGIGFLALFGISLLVSAGVTFDLVYKYGSLNAPINILGWFLANAAIHLVTDIAIFILPVPLLGRLRMRKTQKLALMASFGLGLLTCVISIIRIATLPATFANLDQTYEGTPHMVWSIVELSVAVICLCIPTLRPLLSHPGSRLYLSPGDNTITGSSGPSFIHVASIPPTQHSSDATAQPRLLTDRVSSSISCESDVVVIRKPVSSFWQRSRQQSENSNSTLAAAGDEIEPVPVSAVVMRTPTIPVTIVTTASSTEIDMPVLEVNGVARRQSEATTVSAGGTGAPRRTRSMRSSIHSDGSSAFGGGGGGGLMRGLGVRRHMSIALTERDSDDDVYYFGVGDDEVDRECPTPLSPPPKSRQSLSESR